MLIQLRNDVHEFEPSLCMLSRASSVLPLDQIGMTKVVLFVVFDYVNDLPTQSWNALRRRASFLHQGSALA